LGCNKQPNLSIFISAPASCREFSNKEFILSEYVLQMKNIVKEYSGNRVLHDVNLSLKPGEIHALIGENGAGKSTLMNILFGMPRIHNSGGFTGEVYFEGKQVNVKTPKEAMDLGIGMVHQEFMLIPSHKT
jgi:simple sugar transport system ATP-binding protein